MTQVTVRMDAHVGERYAEDVFASSIGRSIPLRWGPRPSLADFDATPLAPGEAIPLPPVREGTATLIGAEVIEGGTAVLLTFAVPEEVTSMMASETMLRHLGIAP